MARSPSNRPAARKTERGPHLASELTFERRQWIAERIGMAAMAALIAAALGGFLGGGGYWSDHWTATGSAAFTYERFVRRSAPTLLDIHLAEAGESSVRVRLERDYLAKMLVKSITPQPRASAVAGPEIEFVFDRSSTMRAEQAIRFELQPQAVGAHHGSIAVGNAAPVKFSQFVYP